MRGKDLSGMRFGKITVVEPTEERIRNAVVWRCRCDCGRELLVESRKLKPGIMESCGCTKAPYEGVTDLTGYQFGKLTVIGKSGNKAKDGNPLWLCRCSCGNTIEVTKRRLITGNTRSCGCGRKPALNDWVGKRFGMLTVEAYVGKEKGVHIWRCRCDCGTVVDVRQTNLKNGMTQSCGCRRNPTKNLHYEKGTCVEMLRPDVMYKTNTSGVRGVYYHTRRKKWIAQIMFRQKCYYLGAYEHIEDAARVRAEAEEKIFGDFLKWYEEEYSGKKKDGLRNDSAASCV